MPFHRQPIIHFLALGILFFAVYNWLNPDARESDENLIIVNQDALLEYLQYRARAFNTDAATAQLAALSVQELADMKAQWVREEALYREALKMGMDKSDYVIRQRLVQKVEYLAQGFVEEGLALSKDDVAQYYADNQQRYEESPSISFTHVFVDGKDDDARNRAEQLLMHLREQKVPFSDATRYGDRFLYHANYVERPADFIAAHFGNGFSKAVMALEADTNSWHGPFASSHGLHLVMLAQRQSGGVPPLKSILSRVTQDAQRARIQERTDEAIERIVSSYVVVDRVASDNDGHIAKRD